MPNPEAIAHWVNRVITFDDSLKNKERLEKAITSKHTKNKRSGDFANNKSATQPMPAKHAIKSTNKKQSYEEYKKAEEDTMNHYMECMTELFVSTCSHNGQESAAGMIARSLSNTVPLLNNLE